MSNHIGGTNKKADTPCTDERVVYIDGKPWVNAPFARSLERELNAANERIKRLEEIGDAIKSSLERGLDPSAQDQCKWMVELPMTNAEYAIFTNVFKAKEAKP